MKQVNLYWTVLFFVMVGVATSVTFVEKSSSPLPIGLAHATSIEVGDKIYIFGGFTAQSSYSSVVHVYDARTDSFNTKTFAPDGIRGSCVASVGENTLQFFGGLLMATGATAPFTLRYSISNDTWAMDSLVSPVVTPICITDRISGNVVLFTRGSNTNVRVTYNVKEKKYETVNMPSVTEPLLGVVQFDSGSFFGITSQNIILVPMGLPFAYLIRSTYNFGSIVDNNDIWLIGGTTLPVMNEWLPATSSVQTFTYSNLAVVDQNSLPFGTNGPIVHKLGGSIHIFGGVVNGAASTKHLVAKCVLTCPINTVCNNQTGLCDETTTPPIQVPTSSSPIAEAPTEAPQMSPIGSNEPQVVPLALEPVSEPQSGEPSIAPTTNEQPIASPGEEQPTSGPNFNAPIVASEPSTMEPMVESQPNASPISTSPKADIDAGNIVSSTSNVVIGYALLSVLAIVL